MQICFSVVMQTLLRLYSNQSGLCFTANVFFLVPRQAPISSCAGRLPRNFCTAVCSRLNFENWVQKFGGPQKNLGAKNIGYAKFGPISDDFKVRRRISPKRIKMFEIDQVFDLPRFLPRSAEQSGELWSTNYGGLEAKSHPPKSTFWKAIFRP